jgi:hypothetical protein
VTSNTPSAPSEPQRAPGVIPARAGQPSAAALPPSAPAPSPVPGGAAKASGAGATPPPSVDLAKRRDELAARVAELQWDLGGLAYEMAIRNHVRVDVLVRRAATLQEVDSELGEVERILRLQESGTAGACASCGAPHSSGAAFCWQCGQPLLEHVPTHAIGSGTPPAAPGSAPPPPAGGSPSK